MTRPVLPPDRGYCGDPRRGAALGRAGKTPDDTATARKFYLRRVWVGAQGYDAGGTYWGLGNPLFWAVDTAGEAEKFFRASDRYDAKATLREIYPNATFFN